MRGIHLDIAKNSKVVAFLEPIKVGFQIAGEGCVSAHSFFERLGILLVGEEFDSVLLKDGRLGRQRTFLFVLRRELASCNLAGLDVGLIEGVDANDGAGYGSGHLPAEEFAAEIVGFVNGNPYDGMSSALQGVNRGILFGIRSGLQSQISKDAVVAVSFRRSQRLAVYRNQTLPFLASRFRQQLF